MAREPDYTVKIVSDNPDAEVSVVGDQVIEATPADVGKVVTVAADGTLVLADAAGGVSDHGALTGLADDDHPQYLTSSEAYTPGGTDVAVADGGTGSSTAANARTALGLAIGTNVQGFSADLAAIAALVSAANKIAYATGAGTWSLTDFTAAARALLDDADASAMLTTLGVSTFIKTLLDDVDAATALATLGAIPLSLIDAADDLIVGSADNTATRLAVAASRIIGKKATGGLAALTAAEVLVITGAIAASTLDANTILYATADDTPAALAVAASRIVGRKSSGDIVALTGAEALVITGAMPIAQSVNAQTGTTYTLVAGDAGLLVTLSNASAITLTVPQDSDATIAVGTYVDLYQLGAGQVTVAAGSGATLRVSGATAKARAQYSRFGVQKVSANTWSLFGDLAAS